MVFCCYLCISISLKPYKLGLSKVVKLKIILRYFIQAEYSSSSESENINFEKTGAPALFKIKPEAKLQKRF